MRNKAGCESEPSFHLVWHSKAVCYHPTLIVLPAQLCCCPEGVRAGKTWRSLPNSMAWVNHRHTNLLVRPRLCSRDNVYGKRLRSLCIRETRGGGRTCTTEEKPG